MCVRNGSVHSKLECIYRISSYKSLPQINTGLVYTPGESSVLSLMNAGLQLNAGSS